MKDRIRSVVRGYYLVGTNVLVWISFVALAGITVLTFLDGSGRYIFSKPITGTFEIVQVFMTLLGGFAILYTTITEGHVAVELIYEKMPRLLQKIVMVLSQLVGIIGWAMISYGAYVAAWRFPKERTVLVHWPLLPVRLVLVFAIALVVVACLTKIFYPGKTLLGKAPKKEVPKKEEPKKVGKEEAI